MLRFINFSTALYFLKVGIIPFLMRLYLLSILEPSKATFQIICLISPGFSDNYIYPSVSGLQVLIVSFHSLVIDREISETMNNTTY